jgi:transcriptional regulator with XRE-family HTH domain
MKQQFGNRLRYLRKHRQFTQAQLAEATGLSVDFVSLIERGLSAPSFGTIESLMAALNVPACQLFWFEAEPLPDLASIVICCPLAGRRSWPPDDRSLTVEQIGTMFDC